MVYKNKWYKWKHSQTEEQQWIKHRAVTPIWLLSVDIFSVKKKKKRKRKEWQALQYKSQGRLGKFTCSRYTEMILCDRRNWRLWDTSALILDSRRGSNRDDGHREMWNNVFELVSNLQNPKNSCTQKTRGLLCQNTGKQSFSLELEFF